MLELVRGYSSAVFDDAIRAGVMGEVVSGLDATVRILVEAERLREALSDPAVPAAARGAVISELLEPRVRIEVVDICTFAIEYERATEVPRTFEQVLEVAEDRTAQLRAGVEHPGEPPVGRVGALERIRGFADRVFELADDETVVDTIEDECFRFARIAEQSAELRHALVASEQEAPLEVRLAVLADLLGDRVRPETLRLLEYVLRVGRARDLVGSADYLVDLAAAERGRRVAEVHCAVDLDEDERSRLAEALGRRMRRPVELRIVKDPSVIGGLDVSVGDTVIDGTVRHRLEQLRESLLSPS